MMTYLSLSLFVPPKELANLVQDTRGPLLPAQPEGALSRSACGGHSRC